MQTDLDIFKIIKYGLLRQNCKSLNSEGNCAYRGYNEKLGIDTMCAVGMIIDDSYYDESIENKSVADEIVLEAVRISNPEWDLRPSGVNMLIDLQSIHDTNKLFFWADAFRSVENTLFDEDGSYKGRGHY